MPTHGDERVECNSCHRMRTAGNYYELRHGENVCRDRNSCIWECGMCYNSYSNSTLSVRFAGNTCCTNCAPPEIVQAIRCGRCSGDFDNDMGDRYLVSGQVWCRSCTSRYSAQYDCCRKRYPNNEEQLRTSGGSIICPSCAVNGKYWKCEPCGSLNKMGGTCNDCGRDSSGNIPLCRCGGGTDTNPIHSHSCTPKLTFNGSGPLFFGVELEIQVLDDDKREKGGKWARKQLEPNLAVLKSDSSIGGGFELVTMPTTYEHYRNESDKLWATVNKIRKTYGGRSWDTVNSRSGAYGGGTCGMHIHVSRRGFTDVEHQHRFIAFIYHNTEMMMKFSGRKNTFAKFDDAWVMDLYEKPHLSVEHKLTQGGDKYNAVNTAHADTFELRFFRGNMKIEAILANLGFVHAMVEYTRSVPTLIKSTVPSANENDDDFTVIEFAHQWEAFVEYVLARPEIYPELQEKLPKVKSINLRDAAQESANEEEVI